MTQMKDGIKEAVEAATCIKYFTLAVMHLLHNTSATQKQHRVQHFNP